MAPRFDTTRAAALVTAARADRQMSQTELARAAGMSQPNVAAIEAGRRSVGPEVLERLLRAADYRPSIPLEESADAIVAAGERYGIHDIRVFGSIAHGSDHFTSDIDLLARVDKGRGYFDIAMFQNAVESLTGFSVDVVVDDQSRPGFLDDAEVLPPVSDDTPRRAGRFARVPRSAEDATTSEIARAKFTESLDAIDTFLDHAVSGGRGAFERNSPAYASGSMAIIRTAALFEMDEFAEYLGDVPDEVVRGITTTRNIASHAGYRSMNDDLFWDTLTVHLPPYLDTWRAAARR
ncbi:helix-turn-helix domain-containing protein [Microbacterium sp. M3]|uniref:Helix-turn-helix domain-containing protein n=2 Tax=Microbacterium arthrosphaerae TaxID=792652 RepID=A0ABU4H591_9MICO|nr:MULTISPECIES: helix-turn-helix domain-containing protein [Microbacterium]MDW4574494.1 helix-turn-helix domain-containing protein [Microbacterium arthrosphaerae]MDW7608349.1 helix-turn-helix domain-containing protein [Microbacterium sp. M3]